MQLSGLNIEKLEAGIRDIIDFPQPGVIYKDITPLLQDAVLFAAVVDLLADRYQSCPPDYIAAIDARGFIFGGALAYRLHCGFIPIRKSGRLPFHTHTESYELEYGSASMQIHVDALKPRETVVVFDDILATGGTAAAAIRLLKKLDAEIVGTEFLMELGFLNGREQLQPVPVNSLIRIS